MIGDAASGTRAVAPGRLERLRRLVVDLGPSDRVLVTAPDDVRWLSGFTGSNGWLLVGPQSVNLLTDGRYCDQARLEAGSMGLDLEPVILAPGQKLSDLVGRLVPTPGVSGSVFFQPSDMTVTQFRELESVLGSALEPCPDLSGLRRQKDEVEIEAIARAARIADAALRDTLPLLDQRPTERDVRDELEFRMRRLGADGPSYDTIVASGPVNSAKPHHRPDGTRIDEASAVVIDVGALVEGYHSDMTRTYFVGEVDAELSRFYDFVHEAQRRAMEVIAPGVPLGEVDRICRNTFVEFGVQELFIHGVGHGVGLAIHENPFIGRTDGDDLRVGDVVTVEPGLYRMGLGGVRIEDLLVVTEDAHRCLTSLPKDSPCLPSPRTT